MADQRKLRFGWSPSGGLVEIALSIATKHLHISGATGFGKSGLINSLLLQPILGRFGVGVVLLDLKGGTAQELRDWFLPAAMERCPHIRPEDICTVTPFSSRYGVPLNPLHPIAGLSSEIQANLVCGLVSGLSDGIGVRMNNILAWLARAMLTLDPSIADSERHLAGVARMLRDDGYRKAIASRVRDPEVGHYLDVGYERENQASITALASRLDWILLPRDLRAQLCSPGALSGSAILESPIAIIDLSGTPMGFQPLAKFAGALIFTRIAAAVMSRPVDADTHPVILCVDEFQELIGGVAGADSDFARLLALSRARRVGLWAVNQSDAQIRQVSPALRDILEENCALRVLFAPTAEDLKSCARFLPVSGAMVDPRFGDRLLTQEAERKAIIAKLGLLPPRAALLVNRWEGSAQVIRTLSLPYDAARTEAMALSLATRRSFERGKYGVPMELLRRALTPSSLTATVTSEAGLSDSNRPQRRRRRSTLEMP